MSPVPTGLATRTFNEPLTYAAVIVEQAEMFMLCQGVLSKLTETLYKEFFSCLPRLMYNVP